jgi:uncharacterized repeat protein (TIGR04076 family)
LTRVKINVIKRVDPKVIFGENVPINPMTGRMFEICSKFKEGQEFIVDRCGEMPEGFCSWAWRRYLQRFICATIWWRLSLD